MKRNKRMKLLIAWFALFAIAVAAQAQEERVIAGWDFSQYYVDGSLINDLSYLPTDTLDANYSDFDPTYGAGAESAAYGTLYMNGLHGSTDVDETAYPAAFAPTQGGPTGGSLASNLSAPQNGVPVSDVPFDTFSILALEGQDFRNLMAMTAGSALYVVFEADLTPEGLTAYSWRISFGAQTFSGNETEVTVEFSTDGIDYTSFGSVIVDANDTPYTVNLASGFANRGFVRLGFDPSSETGGQPIIDNVAITATLPESQPVPSISLGGLALLAGLMLGIAACARRGS